MSFPIEINSIIQLQQDRIIRSIKLYGGLTVILGSNGSGKTHLLRGLKESIRPHIKGKKPVFISAGRIGTLEYFRSDHNGLFQGQPNFDAASFGHLTDIPRRHAIESINGGFQTLSQRADILIKVQERLRKLFKRDISISWDSNGLRVIFSKHFQNPQSYSAGREASGLMHLISILAALYDDEVGALLLDEPEVSLHPQLQSFLLNEILSVAGLPENEGNKKIIVIATHSTEMIAIKKPTDLSSLVFCYDLMQEPVQIPPDAGELRARRIEGLIARLGQEHKLSLFASRPLLVEGPSDVIICSTIASKLNIRLEAAGSQLLPVIGKGQLTIVSKLLRLLGKTPVALADADGICDGTDLINSFVNDNPSANMAASESGAASATALAAGIYTAFCKLVEERWDEISHYAESHPYWANKNDDDEILAKRRSVFCTLFERDDEELKALNNDNAWVVTKKRFNALLKILEASGLFILRKGSIESYYLSADNFTSTGKPNAAADETDHLLSLTPEEITASYNEIVNCIKFAANSAEINEKESLKDLLLAIASPAHDRFKRGEDSLDYNLFAQSILGERASIFDISVNQDNLVIDLKSKILDISGFPILINRHDNLSQSIDSALR